MKKLILSIMFLAAGILIYSQTEKGKMMPVTTSSKSALTFYSQAMKYLDDVSLVKALESFNKALEQDPDFFMANYQLAFFFLMNRAHDDFEKFADAAINSKAKLSDAELQLKDALVSVKRGRLDVTGVGKKLLEMYPDDPNAYSNLVYFQSLAGDSTGMVETLSEAVKVARDPAPFYNQLGYAYLTLKLNDKAEAAFDKYIELEPRNPNAYDSKGDFFMYIKKYDKAFELYMKAHSMDPSFSKDKAELAKRLYEQTEGRKLDIIPM